MPPTDSQLLDIVHDIYAVALDATLWPAVLQKIARMVGADAGTVWIHDFADSSALIDGAGPNIAAFVGFEPGMVESYAAHYSARNVWAAKEDRFRPGSAVTSSMLYPDSLLKRTEFYGDWLQRQDLFYALGSVVEKQESRAVKMSFLRSEAAGSYDERALGVMRTLMPHLQTAVRIHRRMYQLQGINLAALAALDRLNFGLLLLGPSGEVRHANRLADRIARRTRAYTTGATGCLQAHVPSLTARLHTAIHRASMLGTDPAHQPATALRLRGVDGSDVHAFVVPLPPAAQSFSANVSAMMFVNDPESALPDFAQRLRQVYLLSPSEAQLAEALVGGKSLKAFADERGTSIHTVRSQLKSLAAKVGAKRQVDVVRCILTGPAVLDL